MFAIALLLGQVADMKAGPPQPASNQVATVDGAALRDEDLLLFSVAMDNRTLSDSIAAYGEPADPLLPIGEISRLLGLNVRVSPAAGVVQGKLGESQRALDIDLKSGIAKVGGAEIPIAAAQVGRSLTDLFFRASVLQRLLPIKLTVDSEELLLTVTPTELLPGQAAAQRDQRLRQLEQGSANQTPVMRVPTNYGLVSAPAVDVSLESGYDGTRDLTTRRYDVRVAADLMRMDFTGYVGSDERGNPSDVRLKLDRRSADGRLLGPLHATYFALGDVFTPVMTLGPQSAGGRGFSFSTAPIGETSVFQRVTLRGELPIGYQVELYVNEVLRGGQRSPVEGRYEFLDVPLSRGLNVLRIVTYGPNGERTEQTRVINVGSGALDRGRLTVDFGVIQQDKPVIDLTPAAARTPGYGDLRAVAHFAYGLRDDLTLDGAVALYPDLDGRQRRMLSVGGRGSLFGVALLGEVAHDITGGSASQIGAAWQLAGISTTLRHTEYAGGFVDENDTVYDGIHALSRATMLDASFSLPGLGRARIPVTVHAERTAYAGGGATWLGTARTSTLFGTALVSAGFDYRRDAFPGTAANDQLSSDFSIARALAHWQLRAVVDYNITPDVSLQSLDVTADRNLSDTLGVHMGVDKLFGPDGELEFEGAGFLHLPFADLSLTTDYATERREWRVGLQLSFGLVMDPWTRQPKLVRAGGATGGSAAVQAFLDANADGRQEPGEAPMPGVKVTGGERAVTTDARGEAFVTGLGDTVSATLHADSQAIDAFYVNSPPQDIELAPRPGKVAAIAYPFTPVSEAVVRLWVTRPDGKRVGLSAVQLQLVRNGAAPVKATSEFDGTAIFENVPPGSYRLELDPAQAKRLAMHLDKSATLELKGDGRAPQIDVDVLFGATP